MMDDNIGYKGRLLNAIHKLVPISKQDNMRKFYFIPIKH